MKTLKNYAISFAIFVSISAFAGKEGGNGSHGGNAELSSVSEAETGIRDAGFALSKFIEFWEKNPNVISDSRAREIALKIAGTTRYADLDNMTRLPYVVVDRGSCTTNEAKKAMGSAKLGKPAEKFCLSVPEIRRIPPLSLREQVPPLMGHELAHQAGFGEADAQHFQKFLLGIYKLAPANYFFQALLRTAKLRVLDIAEGLEKGENAPSLCLKVGELKGTLRQISGFDQHFHGLTWDYIYKGWRINSDASTVSLAAFCERGAPAKERNSLAAPLKLTYEKIEQLHEELQKRTSMATVIIN